MRLEYRIIPRHIAILLAGVAAYFAIQSLIADYLVEVRLDTGAQPYLAYALDLFSVNAEASLPTWYATLLLFGASCLLWLIGTARRGQGGRDAWRWFGLAAIFLYLSLDEGVGIHEIAAEWLQRDFELSGFLTFGWQLVALPFLLAFGVVYVRFWLGLPGKTRRLFLVAALIYVGGAVVVEGISANQWDIDGGLSYGYLAIATVEEFCEMIGIVVFLYALLDYAVQQQYAVVLQPARAETTAHLWRRPRPVMLALAVIVLANAAVVASVLALERSSDSVGTDGSYVYQSLIDQLMRDGVVVARLRGRFRFDAPPDDVLLSLADTFPRLTIVSLMASDTTLVLAGHEIPLTYAEVTDILHANGETQFVILEDSAVRLALQRARP